MKKQQKVLVDRINKLCKERNLSKYALSYRASIPLTTLTHIMNGTSQNPGIFTIIKICDGLKISLKEFFDTKEFLDLLKEVDEEN